MTARRDSACGLVLVLLLTAFAQGCYRIQILSPAPSNFSTGIIVYEHANYQGDSAHITADVPTLRWFCAADKDASNCTGPWDCEKWVKAEDGLAYPHYDWEDCISSVRVAPGWRATLYRGGNYHDDSLEITEDMPNLELVRQHDCPKGGLNDCVSSLRVRRQ